MRRCGCARKCLNFVCLLKFRLGLAGQPNVCSHCYHVLNEGNYKMYFHPGNCILVLISNSKCNLLCSNEHLLVPLITYSLKMLLLYHHFCGRDTDTSLVSGKTIVLNHKLCDFPTLSPKPMMYQQKSPCRRI